MARDMQSIVKMSRREGYALHPKAIKPWLNVQLRLDSRTVRWPQ